MNAKPATQMTDVELNRTKRQLKKRLAEIQDERTRRKKAAARASQQQDTQGEKGN